MFLYPCCSKKNLTLLSTSVVGFNTEMLIMFFLIQFFTLKKHSTTLAIGYWLLAIGYWLLAIGYWLLAIGYWLLTIGYWLLAIRDWLGYRLSAIGYLLLAFGWGVNSQPDFG